MPHFVVEKVQNALNDRGKAVKGSHVHILGVAYKRDIEDARIARTRHHPPAAAPRSQGHVQRSPCASIRIEDGILAMTDALKPFRKPMPP